MSFGRNFPVLLVIVIAAVFLSAGCTGTESPSSGVTVPSTEEITIPDLVGTWVWSGDLAAHSAKRDFNTTATSWTMTVTDQEERTFTGYKEMEYNGTLNRENFSGAISYDGKTIYFADHDEGFTVANVISADEIELIYLDDGDNARAMIIYLIRA